MNWFSGLWTITSIELRQRVRGAAWYVLLAIFVAIVLIVTVFTTIAVGGQDDGGGALLYSLIVYFVLLLGTLVTPALSGNAINGDRDNGTLATTQVTLVTTGQLVMGKFLAAWITALAFLGAALPFLIFALALGGSRADTAIVAILVLIVELGVVAAVGVGLSGLIRRPLFSVVATYLVVAFLSIGTVIAFGLGGAVDRVTVTHTYETIDWDKSSDEIDDETGYPVEKVCYTETSTYDTPRFDRVWWVLTANPYVLLADAVPTRYSKDGYPDDLFGNLKWGVRQAQLPPSTPDFWSDCTYDPTANAADGETARDVIESTVPSWAVGLGLHVLLGGLLMVGAVRATHAPTTRLAAGSRVA